MKGSGASGNRRRAAERSPPWLSGSCAPLKGIMSVALALIAMLIELCIGYPHAVLRAVGHPVTWIGTLIEELDRVLNRDGADPGSRRAAGIMAILVIIAIVGSVAFLVERT